MSGAAEEAIFQRPRADRPGPPVAADMLQQA